MRLTEYQPSAVRLALRRSALAMYLTLNVRAHTVLKSETLKMLPQRLGKKDYRWSGNVSALSSDEQVADYRWAVDKFLDLLPAYTGVGTDRILISFDGFRSEMYEGPGSGPRPRQHLGQDARLLQE